MKRFAILAAAAVFLPASALADTVVLTPKTASKEEAAAYVQKLESAIKRECRKATSPILDIAYYQYHACLAATRADVAKKDPTGLYAKADSKTAAVLAAR